MENSPDSSSGSPETTSLCLRVFGRIQGVGFRFWAYKQALRLNIRGWIRNEADGTVSCECQGQPDAVKAFTEALRRGPAGARVDRIEAGPVPRGRIHGRFEITY
jgi:acylphosphatase